jgi:hypothetical protein
VDFGVGQADPGFGHILNSVLGSTTFSCQTSNRSGKVITLERFDILNHKRVEKEIIKPKQCQSVVDFKTKNECSDKIRGLLDICYRKNDK